MLTRSFSEFLLLAAKNKDRVSPVLGFYLELWVAGYSSPGTTMVRRDQTPPESGVLARRTNPSPLFTAPIAALKSVGLVTGVWLTRWITVPGMILASETAVPGSTSTTTTPLVPT